MNNISRKFDIQSDKLKMLLQVHDELVFEIKEGSEAVLAKDIQGMMQSAYDLKVPLVAEIKIGRSWGEMQPLEK